MMNPTNLGLVKEKFDQGFVGVLKKVLDMLDFKRAALFGYFNKETHTIRKLDEVLKSVKSILAKHKDGKLPYHSKIIFHISKQPSYTWIEYNGKEVPAPHLPAAPSRCFSSI